MNFLSKLFGNERRISQFQTAVDAVNALEAEIGPLSLQELRHESDLLKTSVQDGSISLDDAMPRAFALVRAAATKTLGQRHYDVQVMGGIALHRGAIAEMRTGEGKTLSATLAVYLNALEGRGVHVITVNDYLAKRDAVWMGQIYHALGLSVACISHDSGYRYDPDYVLSVSPLGVEAEVTADKKRDTTGAFKIETKFLRPVARQEAYQADITYGTNHEFGFDYLRDNMAYHPNGQVQRGHHYAIVDEIDSVLIDEAKTPLIIAAPDQESSDLYRQFARIADRLVRETDYTVDEKFKMVTITESGIAKVEKAIGVENIYDSESFKLVHYLEESLRAVALFKRDKDYVIKDGEVLIVDPFTGRILMGRRYSGGLHQAIEAKENVRVKEESKTVASITIQNYFRMYKKLGGMTGTAQTSAEEFESVYGLDVVTIPTNQPMVRKDNPDLVYKTTAGRYIALIRDVQERHRAGQPILIGTVAIEKNEMLSQLLREAGVEHEVLNAKNHEREGEIIAQAGRKGAVTVATNMAGRGVDIILGGNPPDREQGDTVRVCGGLHVIGTERHESRRIDNQLRGRAGRQGDPGSSQFYLSLEDDLMRVFGGDRLKGMMDTLKMPEDMPIESGLVSRSIEQAQAKIEGFNFDARKHTLEYDDVLNKQRQAVYDRRQSVLHAQDAATIKDTARGIIASHSGRLSVLEKEELVKALMSAGVIERAEDFEFDILEGEEDRRALSEYLEDLCAKRFENVISDETAPHLKVPMLQIIDSLWMSHLENIDALRESVRLRAYGQHDPLVEFRREAFRLFQDLFANFESSFFGVVFRLRVNPVSVSASQPSFLKNAKTIHASGVISAAPAAAAAGGNYAKVGRNDPCPCGSGKKYKKCHGK